MVCSQVFLLFALALCKVCGLEENKNMMRKGILNTDENGKMVLTGGFVDVNLLQAERLKNLVISDCNLSWSNGIQPTYLPKLETFRMKLGKLNPKSIIFSEKLKTLSLSGVKLLNGNIYDILRTSTLESLTLSNMGEIDLASVKAVGTLRYLQLDGNCTIKWNVGDKPIFLSNLENFDTGCVLDPRSIIFTEKLKELNAWPAGLINGSIYDLLKTGTHLHGLTVQSTNGLDISKLPSSEYLTTLSLFSQRVYCSAQVKFRNLDYLYLGYNTPVDQTTFCNFSKSFPSLPRFNMGKSLGSPTFILYLLEKTSIEEVVFIFDLNPPVKTYEYGRLMKVMMENGLSNHVHSEFFNRPQDFSESRFVSPWISKKYLIGVDRLYTLDVAVFNSKSTWDIWDLKFQEMEQPLQQKIAILVCFLFLAILLLTGIVGNLVTVLVMGQKKMRNSSGLIILSLAIYDLLVVFTYSFTSIINSKLFYAVFIAPNQKYQISELMRVVAFQPAEHAWMTHRNSIQTFLIYPLNKTAYTGSVYSIVLISVERFVAICWPFKSRLLLTTRNSKLSILVIFIFSVVLNIPRWIESYQWDFYSGTSLSWNDYYKPMLMRMESFRVIYHGVIWTTAMYIFPFILVGFFNFKLGRKIIQSKRERRGMQNIVESRRRNADTNETTSVTKMLLCVVTVFVICNIMHMAIVFYFLVAYEQIEISTIEAISCLPLIVNSSVNFIIYVVMGKTLRAEFLRFIPKSIRSRFLRNLGQQTMS